MAINNVTLMGRLCSSPELKTTTSGTSVTSFTIAVERKYTPQGEEKKADFIDCVAWRNTADFICKYFNKGSMIAVEGEIQTRNYQDKNGNNRKSVEVLIDNASFCGGKSESGTTSEPDPLNGFAEKLNDMTADGNNDDLPF